MGKMLRLDKVLAHLGYGTRNEVKKIMKKGLITVDGEVVRDAAVKVKPEEQVIMVGSETINYKEFIYLMLNKPAGLISATEDERAETVLSLLAEEYQAFSPFPVGRLDKDTEGLLLLTNDGKFAHNLTSPKKKVPKTYYAKIRGEVDEADRDSFTKGVTLDDGYQTQPAKLKIIYSSAVSAIELTITEGKYHQVKRMFQARGKEVIYLKRLSIGNLLLDENLELGEYRELTDEEIDRVNKSQ